MLSNDLIYIPTQEDMNNMNWKSDKDKADFEAFIMSDKNMRENRGKYSERNQFRIYRYLPYGRYDNPPIHKRTEPLLCPFGVFT